MSRPASPPLWLLVVNLLLMVVVAVLAIRVWTLPDSPLPKKQLTALRLVLKQALDEHIDQHDAGDLLDQAIDGLAHSLDQWSDYVPEKEVKGFEESNSGRYGGVGIHLIDRSGPPAVWWPMTGGPAERAGLEPGDVFVTVGGVTVATDSRPQHGLADLLRGEPGSQVRVEVLRRGEPRTFTIERAVVQRSSIHWIRLVDAEAAVGYAYVATFQHGTAAELDAAVEGLLARGMKALVLDVRGNPGGLLDSAVAIANRFVERGNIVTLRKRDKADASKMVVSEAHDADPKKCRWPKLPLVLLADGGSASASEVLAGALQDHARARVVGVHTYGKGFVQSIYTWPDLSFRLKLTTAHYYTPLGRDIDRRLKAFPTIDEATGKTVLSWRVAAKDQPGGIAPDVEVTIDTSTAQRLGIVLDPDAYEIPERWRDAAKALAKERNVAVMEAFGPDADPQLAAAIAEARKALGLPHPSPESAPTSRPGGTPSQR